MEDKVFTYLIEAYKTATSYFDGYSNRYATRFNIFLTIEVALTGFFLNIWFNIQSSSKSSQGLFLIPVLGVVISCLLYVQSAQDKYILKKQIKRVNEIRQKIEQYIQLSDIPALFTPLDDTDIGQREGIYENLVSWRSNWISLTRVPPITSIVLVVWWILVLLFTLLSH